jgi:hypothetical protein
LINDQDILILNTNGLDSLGILVEISKSGKSPREIIDGQVGRNGEEVWFDQKTSLMVDGRWLDR